MKIIRTFLLNTWLMLLLVMASGIFFIENAEAQSMGAIGCRLIILGTIQDAGSPQAGCNKACCKSLYAHPDPQRMVVSLGLVDNASGKQWMFEATPDFTNQLQMLNNESGKKEIKTPDGIFLTHAHIGHYTGLMYLGREAMNSHEVPVYTMPRMKTFLEQNGPWNQLVSLNNIRLISLQQDSSITIENNISVTPLLVPHRDEFSETVGFRISGPNKKALFIPDIDKWQRWSKDIVGEIQKVDYALIDATFFSEKELPNRNLLEIPHPLVVESMELFRNLSATEKSKIVFIHFNHTNPLLNESSTEYKQVIKMGFRIAKAHDVIEL